jgi:hypothetical protein
MSWLLLAGSLAGVLGIVWIARLLKLGGMAIVSNVEACRIAEEGETGFAAEAVVVSSDGSAALVRGQDGTLILLKVHGANIATRRLSRPLTTIIDDGDATVVTGERMFGDVRFRLSREDRDKLHAMV